MLIFVPPSSTWRYQRSELMELIDIHKKVSILYDIRVQKEGRTVSKTHRKLLVKKRHLSPETGMYES